MNSEIQQVLMLTHFADMILDEALKEFDKNLTLLGDIGQVDFLIIAVPNKVLELPDYEVVN